MVGNLKEKPVIMKPMPRFKKIVLGEVRGVKYVMIPISKYDTDYIRNDFEFLADPSIDDKIKDKIGPLDINGYTVFHKAVVLYGRSDELDNPKVRAKFDDIITHHASLTVPTPIDLKNLKVGNKLNTGATGYQYFLYALGLIGNPSDVLIFKL